MAINPNVTYPAGTTAPSADYPYGGPQNITTPGDGSGTPWEAAGIGDIYGFFQALLTDAGITPSGNSETALESQYLQAIQKLSGKIETANRTINIPADFPATAVGIQDAIDSVGQIILPNVKVTIEFDNNVGIDIGANALRFPTYVGGGVRAFEAVNKTGAGAKVVKITGTGAQGFPSLNPYDTANPQDDQRYLVTVSGGDFTLLGDIEFELTGTPSASSSAILVYQGKCNMSDCVVDNQATTGSACGGITVINGAQLTVDACVSNATTPFGTGNSYSVAAFQGGKFTAVNVSGTAEYGYLVEDAISSEAGNATTPTVATKLETRGQIYS